MSLNPTRLRALLVASIAWFAVLPDTTAQTTTRSSNHSRVIEVRVKHSRSMRGMTATYRGDISGSVSMDSYDSGDPTKSVGGAYSAALSGANGFIGVTTKTANYLDISGSVKLAGQLGTGAPGVLKIAGANVSVGSKAWVAAGSSGVQPGYLQDDLNVSYPDVIAPFTPSAVILPPAPGIVNGTNYTFVLAGGNYYTNNFSMASFQVAIVTGKTVLYIGNTFDIRGGATLIIQPGATLDIYLAGSASINGGAIINLSGKAENLTLFGLPSNTSIVMAGNAAFYGSIYAPSAIIKFSGTSDFYGASVSREIDLPGDFAFHYDEALARKGMQYLPIGWKEL